MKTLIIVANVALSVVLSSQTSAETNQLKPFISDGCSLFPDGTMSKPTLWRHCCIAHDYDYWQGGTKQQRVASDQRLEACVNDATGFGLGYMMYFGVRFGGSPTLATPFRWGFGWQNNRGYQPLTPQKLVQIKTLQFTPK